MEAIEFETLVCRPAVGEEGAGGAGVGVGGAGEI